MSLIVSCITQGGIVMSADRKVSSIKKTETQQRVVVYEDLCPNLYEKKIFSCSNNCGISICGDLNFGPIEFLEIINEFSKKVSRDVAVSQMPKLVLNLFSDINTQNLETQLHFGGYEKGQPKSYSLVIGNKNGKHGKTEKHEGVLINGIYSFLANLFRPAFNPYSEEYDNQPIKISSIDEAIEFSSFAIQTTVKMMRFAKWPHTVGGEIDTLVITSNGNSWVNK